MNKTSNISERMLRQCQRGIMSDSRITDGQIEILHKTFDSASEHTLPYTRKYINKCSGISDALENMDNINHFRRDNLDDFSYCDQCHEKIYHDSLLHLCIHQ